MSEDIDNDITRELPTPPTQELPAHDEDAKEMQAEYATAAPSDAENTVTDTPVADTTAPSVTAPAAMYAPTQPEPAHPHYEWPVEKSRRPGWIVYLTLVVCMGIWILAMACGARVPYIVMIIAPFFFIALGLIIAALFPDSWWSGKTSLTHATH